MPARCQSRGRLAALALASCAACGTTREGARWGESATLTPGWDRVLVAARDAALDPWTWAPAAGAAVFAIDDWDREVSDWARAETPIFGDEAASASDDLRAICRDAWRVSMVITPSGGEAWPWVRNKLQGFAVEWSATVAAGELTQFVKETADRPRPNGADERSFSSGHSQSAATSATLACRNLEAVDDMPAGLRGTLQGGLILAAAGTGWARVEAGMHYPSDVLFGSALGHFVAAFVHDAFLGPASGVHVEAHAAPESGTYALGLTWAF